MTNDDMNEVERQVTDILKPKTETYYNRRPVVTTIPAAVEAEEVPEQTDPSITERLKTISGHLHLLHSYVANRADALESKLDQIIAILK